MLEQEYDSTQEGLAAIDELDGWYQENYPDFYADNQEVVQDAVGAIKEIFSQTVFHCAVEKYRI